MDAAALRGGFADPAIESARAFRAILNAMARPGLVAQVSGALPPASLSVAAGVALLVLADGTTPVHLAGACDVAAVRDWLAFHTGAPLVAAEAAEFAVGTWDALLPLQRFPLGTADYPDRSATLIVEVSTLSPATHRLTGPGIATAAALALPGEVGVNAGRFPLGLDLILTSGAEMACLPRSTKVEAL
ncbi:alpha-D-ribose 1-methylphosphonate 5-triphosphate synthase subunit PhnH [mine drainage metagenome]|uniref:Alpha-D-ribose 1-methylphosphonate 5-triphosphate synthase subunit PhnH n=1 Tax=mine drainage metagenome TaxID=410659 RepID=A0A1J5QHE8_9ZZZZ